MNSYKSHYTFVENKLDSFVKLACITILKEQKEMLCLKALSEFIYDENNLKKKEIEDVQEKIGVIYEYIGQLIKALKSDRAENRLHQIYNITHRTYSEMYSELSNSFASFRKIKADLMNESTELKRLEMENSLLIKKATVKEEEAIDVCGYATSYMMFNTYETTYCTKWYNAKVDQTEYFYGKHAEELEKQKTKYRNLTFQENLIFESQLEYLNGQNIELRNKIDTVNRNQEKLIEKYDNKLIYMQKARANIYKAYNDALQTLEDHKNWVRQTRMNDAAIIIQNAWREVLRVRAEKEETEKAALAKKLKLLEKKKQQNKR